MKTSIDFRTCLLKTSGFAKYCASRGAFLALGLIAPIAVLALLLELIAKASPALTTQSGRRRPHSNAMGSKEARVSPVAISAILAFFGINQLVTNLFVSRVARGTLTLEKDRIDE